MTVTDDDVAQADGALEPLRQGFAADGAGLDVAARGDHVEVRLVLTDESCGDCIVGPEILRGIVLGRLAEAGVTSPVKLVDPRG